MTILPATSQGSMQQIYAQSPTSNPQNASRTSAGHEANESPAEEAMESAARAAKTRGGVDILA